MMKTIEELGIDKTPWGPVVPSHPWLSGFVVSNGNLKEGDTRRKILASDVHYRNVRMLAAAPKLYERLREAVIEKCHCCANCGGHPNYECRETADRCFVKEWRAALAEAAVEDVYNV